LLRAISGFLEKRSGLRIVDCDIFINDGIPVEPTVFDVAAVRLKEPFQS
jgi:hypothetical protein